MPWCSMVYKSVCAGGNACHVDETGPDVKEQLAGDRASHITVQTSTKC